MAGDARPGLSRVIFGLLALAGAVLGCTAEPPPTAPSNPDSPAQPPFSPTDARAMEDVLSSPNASPALSAGVPIAGSVLPVGADVDIDETAFVEQNGLATVPATVTGAEGGRWLLLLTLENGSWRVYGTRRT